MIAYHLELLSGIIFKSIEFIFYRSLDPLKEAKADLLLASRGIKTYEQVTRERSGGSWFENVEQLKKENELLADAGGVIGSSTELEDQEDTTATQQNGN